MRFLVDENVPSSIGHFLRQTGHDTLIIRESHLRGSSDAALWELAVLEQRVVVTHDRDFPLQGMRGVPAGVILIRPHDNRPASILALFEAFWSAVREDDVLNHVVSVQPGRYRSRSLG